MEGPGMSAEGTGQQSESATVQPLLGRTALITGAGRNIGRAIALALAGAGANIILNGRSNGEILESAAAEVRDFGVGVLTALADVSDPAQVESMVERASEEFGTV